MTTLVDAGPIVAQFDANESQHRRCADFLRTIDGPLVTCEAVLAEAAQLMRHLRGAAKELLLDVRDRVYIVEYRLSDREAVS